MFFDTMHTGLSILERVNFLSIVLAAHLSHVGTRGGEDAAWLAYVMWKYGVRKPFFSHRLRLSWRTCRNTHSTHPSKCILKWHRVSSSLSQGMLRELKTSKAEKVKQLQQVQI